MTFTVSQMENKSNVSVFLNIAYLVSFVCLNLLIGIFSVFLWLADNKKGSLQMLILKSILTYSKAILWPLIAHSTKLPTTTKAANHTLNNDFHHQPPTLLPVTPTTPTGTRKKSE